jgi:hypothetical protein
MVRLYLTYFTITHVFKVFPPLMQLQGALYRCQESPLDPILHQLNPARSTKLFFQKAFKYYPKSTPAHVSFRFFLLKFLNANHYDAYSYIIIGIIKLR